MRSPLDAVLLGACVATAAGAASAAALALPTATPPQMAAAATPPSPDEIRAAVEDLRADPNLGREKRIRTLRWTSAAAQPPSHPPSWIVGLLQYLGRTASALLWVLGTMTAALAVIWALRLLRERRPRMPPREPAPPERIGGLDIRAGSLPEDIGSAAAALAATGQARAALVLLYRGALSRAVHRFAVPIAESYTEGEALRAVALRLEAPRTEYFRALIGLRRQTVYAGESVAREPLERLCRDFAAALDAAPP